MRAMWRVLSVGLLLVVGACDTAEEGGAQDRDSRWDVGQDVAEDIGEQDAADVGADAAVDAQDVQVEDADAAPDDVQMGDADAGSGDADAGPTDFEVVFELRNESGRPLYTPKVVRGDISCDTQYWVDVSRAGQPVGIKDNTCVSNCEDGTPPIACDIRCEAPTASDYLLADGDSRRVVWDAQAWVLEDEGRCESPREFTGEALRAEFCYASSFDLSRGGLIGVVCEEVEFSLDRPSQVVEVVVGERAPNEVTFRMINETGRDLYAHTGSPQAIYDCYGDWYSVQGPDAPLSLVAGCDGRCGCDEVAQNPGEVCRVPCPSIVPCAAPTAEAYAFPAGSAREDIWDGGVPIDDEVDGQSCRRRVAPLVDDLVATFCYAERVDDGAGYAELVDPICQDVRFSRVTNDVVELRIQP